MWSYESLLRVREASTLLGRVSGMNDGELSLTCDPCKATRARRLVFTHTIVQGTRFENSWQRILENGSATETSSRKDPKYVTHGLHAYKGKFYPQLAKGLMNILGTRNGAIVLDPFCGSGTTLLEGYLNGLRTYGCDIHPLAVKIARAKTGILDVDPRLVLESFSILMGKINERGKLFPPKMDELPFHAHEEICHWFPQPVIYKLNWILERIRAASTDAIEDFFEVVLSDILREVSQQDPADLRIRRRKEPLVDANVLGLFTERLTLHMNRLERFWSVRGYSPYRFWESRVQEGDSTQPFVYRKMGLDAGTVDLVLTSPPYATALPYIDTDRLSLLVLFGMNSTARRPVEERITGSREISKSELKKFETEMLDLTSANLPSEIGTFISELYRRNLQAGVGFRRRNLPALLYRFFCDMKASIGICHQLLASGGKAGIVIGDSHTTVGEERLKIPTTHFIRLLAIEAGFEEIDRIAIAVSTENLKHIKNAIRENTALILSKP